MVILAVSVALVGTMFGLIHVQHSRTVFSWSRELNLDLRCRDVLVSAVAEATFETMRSVNDPDSPAFQLMRTAAVNQNIRFEPELVHTKDLFANVPEVETIKCQVTVMDRVDLGSLGAGLTPWSGYILIEAWMTADADRSKRVLLRERREIKASSILPPEPFDQMSWFEWNTSAQGFQSDDLANEQAFWRDRLSTLRISESPGGPDVNTGLSALAQRLDGNLNGVIYVDNPTQSLILDDVVHRGKTVLVVRGALTVSDLKLEDPAFDSLVIIAYGPVTLKGDVQAAVVLTQEKGESAPNRVFRSLNLLAPLFLLTGSYQVIGDARRPQDLTPMNPSPGLKPNHIYVSISPQILNSFAATI